MLQWVQVASLRSCTITHHLELKKCSKENSIVELREELVRLKESYAREIRLLKEKVKKVEDKYSAGQKEWKA